MPARGEDGLFGALEAKLKKAKEPLDCAALFDRPSIKAHAVSVNRVSDYLGHLWRKGKVLRPPISQGRPHQGTLDVRVAASAAGLEADG